MSLRQLAQLFLLLVAALAASSFAPAATVEGASAPADREILVMVRHPLDHYRATGAYGGGYGDELARSARQHLARRIAHQYGLTLVDDWAMPMIGVDCFVMVVPQGRSTKAAAEQVSHDADVDWAEAAQLYSTRGAAHNDPLYAAEPAAGQWHLADLHRIADGRGTVVRSSTAASTRAIPTLPARWQSTGTSSVDSHSSLSSTALRSRESSPPRPIIELALPESRPARGCWAFVPAGNAEVRQPATR